MLYPPTEFVLALATATGIPPTTWSTDTVCPLSAGKPGWGCATVPVTVTGELAAPCSGMPRP